MLLAPLAAEVLPGATRLSSLFVLPIEICVWGGGAVLIRAASRRWQLGWRGTLLLALALAVAEECLIQQTSLAPMVFQLKGEAYARAVGVNYVYLLWALAYEPIFVLFIPVALTELLFPDRREQVWVSRSGLLVITPLFLIGCVLAWYSWTQIARPQVFHVPVYHPPALATVIALGAISGLVSGAFAPSIRGPLVQRPSLAPPHAAALGMAGALWAALWYGLVLLAFGVAPSFLPAIAVCGGLILLAPTLILLPRWASHQRWRPIHTLAIVFGTLVGAMGAGFAGFIGALPADLWFKVVADVLAVILLAALGVRVRRRTAAS
jgi:hypothetical protein